MNKVELTNLVEVTYFTERDKNNIPKNLLTAMVNVPEESLPPMSEEEKNPIKTMQDVFLEQHPETKLNMNGVLDLCPAISAAYEYGSVHCKNTDRSCGFCRREFWLQEVN